MFSALINFGMLILIWLVQVIIYPSMRYWDSARFRQSHSWYTKKITLFIILLMPLQAALSCLQFYSSQSFISLIQLFSIAIAWLVTFAISVPTHRKLGFGYATETIEYLIKTNWLRTISWTIVSVADLIEMTLIF